MRKKGFDLCRRDLANAPKGNLRGVIFEAELPETVFMADDFEDVSFINGPSAAKTSGGLLLFSLVL